MESLPLAKDCISTFAVDTKMNKEQSLPSENFLLGMRRENTSTCLVQFSVVPPLILLSFLFGKIAKVSVSYLVNM